MSGHVKWWLNRKSRMGLAPSAKAPPHVHGKPWWTTPPTVAPQPEHIEYVVGYLRQIEASPGSVQRNVLLGCCSDWLRAARQLLHEHVASQRGDLNTTDGLLVAASRMLCLVTGRCVRAGLLSDDERAELDEVKQAIDARSARIRRERAIEAAKRGPVVR